MKVAKIMLNSGSEALICEFRYIESTIEESSEVGDKYTIEIIEMSQEDLDALPDFGGF